MASGRVPNTTNIFFISMIDDRNVVGRSHAGFAERPSHYVRMGPVLLESGSGIYFTSRGVTSTTVSCSPEKPTPESRLRIRNMRTDSAHTWNRSHSGRRCGQGR